MPSYQQLPGTMSIAFRRGDEFACLIDFSIVATDYTWSATIFSQITGETIATPAVTVVSAALGQINVALTELQPSALQAGTYGWRLVWVAPGTVTRTALEGACEVS